MLRDWKESYRVFDLHALACILFILQLLLQQFEIPIGMLVIFRQADLRRLGTSNRI